ncbi:MAG: DUF4147 domain-containing protein [Oscillospiraceae bacterium]
MRILNMDTLAGHGNRAGRRAVCEILNAGMEAGDPYNATLRLVRREGSRLTVGNADYEPEGAPRTGPDVFDLDADIDRVFVFAAGKGLLRVVKALAEVLGPYLSGGVAIAKYGDEEVLPEAIEVFHGAHPVPDENCVTACVRMLEVIDEAHLTSRDLVFTAIGNGIGSLMTYPVEGVQLEAVKAMVHLMQIEKGVPTSELSVLRNQLDRIKGGRLTRRLAPAKMVHILAIDANRAGVKDTGYHGLIHANVWLHTMPDSGTREQAVQILKKWDAWERVDASIRAFFEGPQRGEPVLGAEEFEALGGRVYGVMPEELGPLPEAMRKAEALGYAPHFINRLREMEAGVMGRFFAMLGRTVAELGQPFPAPCALFFTGEMLVTVGKGGGVGGRNQEAALSAALVLQGKSGIVVGCVDTDGTDGPGGHFDDDAAKAGVYVLSGGVVDTDTWREAQEKGIDMAAALKAHATSKALWGLDSGVWATQNISVQDLVVVLVQPAGGQV